MTKQDDIVIYGSGAFGREILWTLEDLKTYNILGFIDEDEEMNGKIVNNYKILGGTEWFDHYDKKIACVISIANPKTREKIVTKLKTKNVYFPPIIHPSTIMSKHVTLSEGVVIQAGCILTVNIVIGAHTQINLDCTIGHDDQIGKFVTISPGVHINGRNRIGDNVFIGSGAVTKEGIKILNNSVIGAGAVVLNDVPENSLCVGVPARVKHSLV